jgi:hypothetical protein
LNQQQCTSCNKLKDLSEFHKNIKYKSGHSYRCKDCVKKVSDKYYLEKREQILKTSKRVKETYKLRNQEFSFIIKEKECCRCLEVRSVEFFGKLKCSKDGYKYHCKICEKEERDLLKDYRKSYYQTNRSKIVKHNVKYRKYKRKTDISIKLKDNISCKIYNAIKRGYKKSKSEELLGCTIIFLRTYLQSKFLPTMTWKNYGSEWHIDHKIPCSSFDLTDVEQQKQCFHYTNLQPLWATTRIIDGIEYIGNINKSDKILSELKRAA